VDKVVIAAGSIEPEDVLFLLSDAVAAWYLKTGRGRHWHPLCFRSAAQTARSRNSSNYFRGLRLSGRIKDDDIAVIRIEISR